MKYILLLVAILPGIVAVLFIYWRDRHEKEPLFYLTICFVFGVLSTWPAIKMEEFGIRDLGIIQNHQDWFMTFTFAFAIIAFSEEFVKFIFLRYYVYNHKEFNEPMDGIVYSVVISMGFAVRENIMYVVERTDDISIAFQIGFLRMYTAVPAHAIFAILMGYFVGLAKFSEVKKNRLLLYGLLSAVILHGTYDFFVFMRWNTMLLGYTLIGGVLVAVLLLHKHDTNSPFKKEVTP